MTDGDSGDAHTVSANSSATGVATVSVNGKTIDGSGPVVRRGDDHGDGDGRQRGIERDVGGEVEFDVDGAEQPSRYR